MRLLRRQIAAVVSMRSTPIDSTTASHGRAWARTGLRRDRPAVRSLSRKPVEMPHRRQPPRAAGRLEASDVEIDEVVAQVWVSAPTKVWPERPGIQKSEGRRDRPAACCRRHLFGREHVGEQVDQLASDEGAPSFAFPASPAFTSSGTCPAGWSPSFPGLRFASCSAKNAITGNDATTVRKRNRVGIAANSHLNRARPGGLTPNMFPIPCRWLARHQGVV